MAAAAAVAALSSGNMDRVNFDKFFLELSHVAAGVSLRPQEPNGQFEKWKLNQPVPSDKKPRSSKGNVSLLLRSRSFVGRLAE